MITSVLTRAAVRGFSGSPSARLFQRGGRDARSLMKQTKSQSKTNPQDMMINHPYPEAMTGLLGHINNRPGGELLDLNGLSGVYYEECLQGKNQDKSISELPPPKPTQLTDEQVDVPPPKPTRLPDEQVDVPPPKPTRLPDEQVDVPWPKEEVEMWHHAEQNLVPFEKQTLGDVKWLVDFRCVCVCVCE
jgi:hypothetical protein